jgi:hypothetical protein
LVNTAETDLERSISATGTGKLSGSGAKAKP